EIASDVADSGNSEHHPSGTKYGGGEHPALARGVEEDRSGRLTIESLGASMRFEKIITSHRAKTDHRLIGCKEINKERAAEFRIAPRHLAKTIYSFRFVSLNEIVRSTAPLTSRTGN